MVRSFFLLFVLSLPTISFSQTEEIVSIEVDSCKLEGTLLLPISKKKMPVALIIAGSGPTDRDGNNPMMKNNSLKMLAEGLADNGIASLRYDKRGVGKSAYAGSKEIDLRFEHYVEDAKSWVDFLIDDKRFRDIIITGHSEGSLLGMIAAQNKHVDKFVSLAGVGRPAADILREQLGAQPPIVLETADPILAKLENGETSDDVPPGLFTLFRPSVQPYLISWFKYNPAKEIAHLDKPVLLIQGTTDIQVKTRDAELLSNSNTKAEIEIIEGMNHVLKPSVIDRMENIKTYNNPDLSLHEALVPTIVSFIER
ncbi:MAG: alpha/beta fold hydrolase [Bacteroidota bacterium]